MCMCVCVVFVVCVSMRETRLRYATYYISSVSCSTVTRLVDRAQYSSSFSASNFFFPVLQKIVFVLLVRIASIICSPESILFIVAIIGIIWPQRKNHFWIEIKIQKNSVEKEKEKKVVETIKSQCVIQCVAIRRVYLCPHRNRLTKICEESSLHGGFKQSVVLLIGLFACDQEKQIENRNEKDTFADDRRMCG